MGKLLKNPKSHFHHLYSRSQYYWSHGIVMKTKLRTYMNAFCKLMQSMNVVCGIVIAVSDFHGAGAASRWQPIKLWKSWSR